MLSDMIARLIEDMIIEENGILELKRNDLAQQIGCVPSQISYVITSRFTPEKGYLIESRRGGGGYIRIIKKKLHKDEYLMHFFHAIGDKIDTSDAKAYTVNLLDNDIITERESYIITFALLEITDNCERANVFRKIILALL